jgi:hypothetical protein
VIVPVIFCCALAVNTRLNRNSTMPVIFFIPDSFVDKFLKY